MSDYTKLDRIKNVVIREKVGIAPIEDKMSETRLRWFEHVKRKCINAPLRTCETINLMHYRRGRGQPKMNWNEVIRCDLKFMGSTEDMTQDRGL